MKYWESNKNSEAKDTQTKEMKIILEQMKFIVGNTHILSCTFPFTVVNTYPNISVFLYLSLFLHTESHTSPTQVPNPTFSSFHFMEAVTMSVATI